MDNFFESKHLMIPLADVQHVEKNYVNGAFSGIVVVTRHTRWDGETGSWANNIFVSKDEVEAFKKAWLGYLGERNLVRVDTTEFLDMEQGAAVLRELIMRVRGGADIRLAAKDLGLKVSVEPLGEE